MNPRRMKRIVAVLIVAYCSLLTATAQIGQHRSDFAVGVNGGYVMSSVSFLHKVPQDQMPGLTAGISARYTCEKYFNSICALVGEVNYAQLGWRERILNSLDEPVPILDPVTDKSIDGTVPQREGQVQLRP